MKVTKVYFDSAYAVTDCPECGGRGYVMIAGDSAPYGDTFIDVPMDEPCRCIRNIYWCQWEHGTRRQYHEESEIPF